MASATPKRETSHIGRGGLFLGHIQALGGARGGYEDKKAVFALSPCIGSFRRLERPLRGCIHPLVVAKRTLIEITALKSNTSNTIARGTTTNTLKHSSIRICHPTWSSAVYDPFGSRSLSEAEFNADYLWFWPSSSFVLDIR